MGERRVVLLFLPVVWVVVLRFVSSRSSAWYPDLEQSKLGTTGHIFLCLRLTNDTALNS